MRVFVLSTGRCGSSTFVKSCEHLTNYTSGHESRRRTILDDRFDYPDQHIECDNRLSWFLGGLGEQFDNTDCFYVHLTRDRNSVASSFLNRWDSGYRGSIIRAFAHGMLMEGNDWREEERLDVCRFYVDTVNTNITEFLKTRPSMTVQLENVGEDFTEFLNRIDARGDLDAALREWRTRHNASTPFRQPP